MATPKNILALLMLLAGVALAHPAPTEAKAVRDEVSVSCSRQRLRDWKDRSMHTLDTLEDIRYQLDRKLETLGELASEEDRKDVDSQMKDHTKAVLRNFFQYGGLIFQCSDSDIKPVVDEIVQTANELIEYLLDIVSGGGPNFAAGNRDAPSPDTPATRSQQEEPSEQDDSKSSARNNIEDFNEAICITLLVVNGKDEDEARTKCKEHSEKLRKAVCVVKEVANGASKTEAEASCKEKQESRRRSDIAYRMCYLREKETGVLTEPSDIDAVCSKQLAM